ncbi:Hypp2927 [Branchiostoma lanceolatum]|uniref:Hypp2927 protein n=1 Tax=Branchiostoma lanceolatum TaxID=7740 RepID=A0A8K0ESD0_BRALA|nr:Hypp2927 [Branchiostoma lanceolatum]
MGQAFLLVFLFTICTMLFQGARGQLTFDMAPPVQWAAVGTDYTLQCLASIPGDYAVNVYFKEGLLIDSEVDRYRIVEEGLTILDVGRGDGGNYTCASQGAVDFTIQGQTFIQLIVTGPPSAPGVLRFSSVGTDSLDVEVSAPEDDGGSPITDYVIQIRQSEQEVEWREFVSQTDDVTSAPLESSTVVNASAVVPTADTYNTPPPPDSPMSLVWIVVPTLVTVTLAVTGLVAFGVHKNVIHIRPGHKVTDRQRSA